MDALEPFLDDSILFSMISERTEPQQPSDQNEHQRNLNSMLKSLNLPTLDDNMETTCTVIQALLRARQSEANLRGKIEDELTKSRSDVEALKIKIQRLNAESDARLKQIGHHENQIGLLTKQHRASLEKLQMEKEELQKQLFKAHQKVTQVQVEIRKKEVECNKVKEQVKRNINDKHQLTRNGFDVIGKVMATQPTLAVYQNMAGWEGWVQVRKQLIDENFHQKEQMERFVAMIQQFVADVYKQLQRSDQISSQYENASCKPPTINSSKVYLPNCTGIIDQIQEQLQGLRSMLFNGDKPHTKGSASKLSSKHIDQGRIIQSSGFTLYDNKENDKKPRAKSSEKTSISKTKLAFARKRPIEDCINVVAEDLSCSLISRISFRDIPDYNEQQSPGFEKPKVPQQKELKKWDFVFKQ